MKLEAGENLGVAIGIDILALCYYLIIISFFSITTPLKTWHKSLSVQQKDRFTFIMIKVKCE